MSTYNGSKPMNITVQSLRLMKRQAEKISMLTAYDFTMATILDGAGLDVILVGDSAANVMAGHPTTLPITLDQMIYHTQCVCRAVKRALVVADLPFGTYQNVDIALESGIRIFKETQAQAVKLEGGLDVVPMVEALVKIGIPVMGHLGLTPQHVNSFGGYKVRAKEEAEAKKLISDALALEAAGCFAIVLEKIPANLASELTQKLKIPTIGIGAGAGTDGQVLVAQDMLGMNPDFNPKFVRKYLDLNNLISAAVGEYINDVKQNKFPSDAESY